MAGFRAVRIFSVEAAAVTQIDNALQTLTAWFFAAVSLFRRLLTAVDQSLQQLLAHAGVPQDARTILVLAIDIVVILLVVRVFGGLVRALLIVFLLLFLVHLVASGLGV